MRTGLLLRVGRVIVPIVKAIYERDLAIRNFVPGVYLAPVSKECTHGEPVELVSKQRFEPADRAKAEELCRKYNETGATVKSVRRKKEKLSPGKLFSLSKLQSFLGKKYKMSMQESLDIVQKLYEEGYLTYPRTNSEYLATAEKEKVRKILASCEKLGYPVRFKDGKNIFDDSKIESHSALTPTYKIPAKGALTERQTLVYAAVFRRFVAVFCAEDCVVERTEIVISVGDLEEFTLKGTVMREKGWTKFDERTQKDRELPPLEKGESVCIDFRPVEKETSPPKHYTIETLNNYLKNPFREEKAAAKERDGADDADAAGDADDREEYRAIFEGLELGTEATRTGIIDNARKSNYIQLKKDVYTILPDGEFLVNSLEELGIVMDKYRTSELGKALKDVFHGVMSVSESVRLAEDRISAAFSACPADRDTGYFGEVVGPCPLCGGDVRRMRDFYGCANYREGCKFSVRTHICERAIPTDALRKLLAGEETGVLDGFRSKKTGQPFSASLRLDESGKAVFVFPDRREPKKPDVPVCPLCGRAIVKGKTAYGCSGWKDGCAFRLPFEKDGKRLTDREAFALISAARQGGSV